MCREARNSNPLPGLPARESLGNRGLSTHGRSQPPRTAAGSNVQFTGRAAILSKQPLPSPNRQPPKGTASGCHQVPDGSHSPEQLGKAGTQGREPDADPVWCTEVRNDVMLPQGSGHVPERRMVQGDVTP